MMIGWVYGYVTANGKKRLSEIYLMDDCKTFMFYPLRFKEVIRDFGRISKDVVRQKKIKMEFIYNQYPKGFNIYKDGKKIKK